MGVYNSDSVTLLLRDARRATAGEEPPQRYLAPLLRDDIMQYRPLTVEEYVVSGVSMKHCMKCGWEVPHNAPLGSLCYFRMDGSPQVLCSGCFDREIEAGGVLSVARFVSPEAVACDKPEYARDIPGLPQKTPDQVERAFAEFRELSPSEIQVMSMQIPIRAKVGDCLEIFGPIYWFSILRCVEWLRESCDVPLRFIAKRWEKWPSILDENIGDDTGYGAWKARLADLAQREFSFRYSVLLSDGIEAAFKKAGAKQGVEHKIKSFEDCKAAICKHQPAPSFPGGEDEFRRGLEYIDANIARLRSTESSPSRSREEGSL